MANEAQLNILRSSVQEWNEWRKNNPDASIDFTGVNFRFINLIETDPRTGERIGVDFHGVNLGGAHFHSARMHRANLRNASLVNCFMSDVKLVGADLSGADLHGSKCHMADLTEANLSGANMSSVDLSFACLNSAVARNTDFRRANMSCITGVTNVDWTGANLSGVIIPENDLSSVPSYAQPAFRKALGR